MLYQFAEYLLLRMPVKDSSDYAADIQHFLDDLSFRSALYLASPTFCSMLERRNFQADKLLDKELTTLQKYINRYCFRPTPFGLFSSVTLLRWGRHIEKDKLSFTYRSHVSASMTFENLLSSYLLDSDLRQPAKFEANPLFTGYLTNTVFSKQIWMKGANTGSINCSLLHFPNY